MKALLFLIALLALCLLIVVGVFVAVCVSAHMPFRAHPSDCLIVLGARVKPDGSMKPTLCLRCETAFDAWCDGVAERIIVCGGQMPGETRPHAEAMRDYLLEKGVPDEHILVENASLNTVQNLQNAAVIMEHRGFRSAALITSDYHLTRAMWIAHAKGMMVCGIPAVSPCSLKAYMKTRSRETISWFLYFFHGADPKENYRIQ